ncbi:MAG: hypothetical protein V1902_01490 [Candidatus Falkowbacteria bacterium]
MTIGQFFLGLIIAGVGFVFVWRTQWIQEFIGYSMWGEKWFGSSRMLYKLIGIVVCLMGVLTMTGLIGGFLNWLVGLIVPSQST